MDENPYKSPKSDLGEPDEKPGLLYPPNMLWVLFGVFFLALVLVIVSVFADQLGLKEPGPFYR